MSVGKQLRTSKKLHLTLPSIAIALESYDRDVLLHPEIIGKYIESLVAVFLIYRYKKIFFWRTPQKDEVDIIIKEKQPLPIEVKYKSQVTDADCKAVVKCCVKFDVKRGIVVTKDTLETRKFNGTIIELIPVWLFLLGV